MNEQIGRRGNGIWPRTVTRDQARDTGMALALVCLILFWITRAPGWAFVAGLLLLADMISPRLFKPLGRVWFGLSNILGSVVSKALIGLAFYLVVTPVGLLRRRMGKDTLKLNQFKQGDESVFVTRDHTYVPADVEQPF